jgi:pyruvate formate lyase activating enzyme
MELLEACKQLDLHTTLDTCGLASWQTIDQIRPYVDLFLYDIKLMDDDQHIQFTGVSNHQILDNLKRLSNLGSEITLRVPIIPGITDSRENLHHIAEFAAALPGVCSLDLLPFHTTAQSKYENLQLDYQALSIKAPDMLVMQNFASQLERYGLNVRIGG